MRLEEVWLIGSLAVALPLLAVCALGWWRASRRARWLEGRLLASERDETTDRLEQVVEGLASQFNELANGQEFLQRMLASRIGPKATESPKVTTPV